MHDEIKQMNVSYYLWEKTRYSWRRNSFEIEFPSQNYLLDFCYARMYEHLCSSS